MSDAEMIDRHRAELAEERMLRETAASIADDEQKAREIAGAAADRFRDVIAEVLGLAEGPGDDELCRQLRSRHGLTGPESTRWRDFIAGAEAYLGGHGIQIGGTVPPSSPDTETSEETNR